MPTQIGETGTSWDPTGAASGQDWGVALQSLAALTSVGPDDRFDKQLRFVEDEEAVWSFDAASVSASNPPSVLVPDDVTEPDPGRWIKVYADSSHANRAALDLVSGTNTGNEVQATESVKGTAELASQAEVNTGTDDTLIVTPSTLSGSSLAADSHDPATLDGLIFNPVSPADGEVVAFRGVAEILASDPFDYTLGDFVAASGPLGDWADVPLDPGSVPFVIVTSGAPNKVLQTNWGSLLPDVDGSPRVIHSALMTETASQVRDELYFSVDVTFSPLWAAQLASGASHIEPLIFAFAETLPPGPGVTIGTFVLNFGAPYTDFNLYATTPGGVPLLIDTLPVGTLCDGLQHTIELIVKADGLTCILIVDGIEHTYHAAFPWADFSADTITMGGLFAGCQGVPAEFVTPVTNPKFDNFAFNAYQYRYDLVNRPALESTGRDVTSATYEVVVSDHYVGCDRDGAIEITLPTAQATPGRVLTIKDEGGHAQANHITIITEGAVTVYVLSHDYEAVTLRCDGVTWQVICQTVPAEERQIPVNYGDMADASRSPLGNHLLVSNAQQITAALPKTVGNMNRFHAMLEVTTVAVAGTVRCSGTSYDPETQLTTPGDTEDVTVTATGWYKTSKYWISTITWTGIGLADVTANLWRIEGYDFASVGVWDLRRAFYRYRATQAVNSCSVVIYRYDFVAKTRTTVLARSDVNIANGSNSRFEAEFAAAAQQFDANDEHNYLIMTVNTVACADFNSLLTLIKTAV